MKFKYKCLLIIPALVFMLDQVTKYVVAASIPFGQSVPVFPGYFDIAHYTNTGAAFGMLSRANDAWRTPFFYVISVVALAAILIYIVPDDP